VCVLLSQQWKIGDYCLLSIIVFWSNSVKNTLSSHDLLPKEYEVAVKSDFILVCTIDTSVSECSYAISSSCWCL